MGFHLAKKDLKGKSIEENENKKMGVGKTERKKHSFFLYSLTNRAKQIYPLI